MLEPLENNEMKNLKGEFIWLIPVLNSIKRNVPLEEQIKSDILEKCGPKKFTLKKYGAYFFEDYCNEQNFGYMPFASKQDALDYLEISSFKTFIISEDFSHLSIGDIKKIKYIIGKSKMIKKEFYAALTQTAKKQFTTKSDYCMSVYRFWEENGYVSNMQMNYLEKGFNGNQKNRSYYGINGR